MIHCLLVSPIMIILIVLKDYCFLIITLCIMILILPKFIFGQKRMFVNYLSILILYALLTPITCIEVVTHITFF